MNSETAVSVDTTEIEKFSRLSSQWWDPKGAFAPLHKLNPLRLQFIRDVAAEHFNRNPREALPFHGLSLLDIGCGGGLLSEPMARLGFGVLGCDASAANVQVASAHAEARAGLTLAYRTAAVEELSGDKQQFDAVLNMEVIEHVADVAAFLSVAVSLVRPGGLMFVATINRTLKSFALGKLAAEYLLGWLPRGTHDWNRFIAPLELAEMMQGVGMRVLRQQGVSFDPLTWSWHLSKDVDVNYIMVATR